MRLWKLTRSKRSQLKVNFYSDHLESPISKSIRLNSQKSWLPPFWTSHGSMASCSSHKRPTGELGPPVPRWLQMPSHWVYHINEIRCKTCFWNLGTWVRPVNLTLARSHSYHGSRHQGIHQPEMQTRDQWPKTGKHQKQSALSNFDPTEDTTWPFK